MIQTRNRKNLVDVFPDTIIQGGGIFDKLGGYDVPWKNDVQGTILDAEYFYNVSGQKNLSPMVRALLGGRGELSNSDITTLSSVILGMYLLNWRKQYATLSMEYNPISNYDMTETSTESGTTTDERKNGGTSTNAHTGTQSTVDAETASGTAEGTTNNDVYGFNSSSAVNDTDTTTNSTNSTQANGTSTRTDDLKDTRTDDFSENSSGTHSANRTLTRSGNIGVTTSQQMIESERNLWMWNFFYNVVFPDVDKILTIQTYSRNATPYAVQAQGGGGSSGGDMTQVLNKLDALEAKVDNNTTSINTNISNGNNAINSNISNATNTINAKIDNSTDAINLSIDALRASTFNAIDGVSNRNY